MIHAKSGKIHVIYLTKDRALDSNMFHNKWKGIRSRVKDTLDVYCDVLMTRHDTG